MRGAIILFCLVFGLGPNVAADPIRVVATGTVTDAEGSLQVLGVPARIGDKFTFTFDWNTSVRDLDASSTGGEYHLGVGQYTLSVGAFTTSHPYIDAFVTVTKSFSDPPYFADTVRFIDDIPTCNACRIRLDFADTTDWLPSDALPSIETLNERTFKSLQVFEVDEEDGGFTFFGGPVQDLTQTSLTPVPEPTSLALVATGLASALGVRRYRQRRRRTSGA
jgi:hypothetical protein